jgi:hypothetical protein
VCKRTADRRAHPFGLLSANLVFYPEWGHIGRYHHYQISTWAYLESHAMPNFCAKDLGEPRHHAGYQLRCMQRWTALIGVFWRQAELF